MKISTYCLMAGFLMTTLFTSCSRPVASVQRTPSESFNSVARATLNSEESPAPATIPVASPASANQPISQAQAAVDQLEASLTKTTAPAATKNVQKRLDRVQTMLAAASMKAAPTASTTKASQKMNLMERMMLKKINKKINKQLSPQNPEKTMLNTGTLATGAVLVIVGLLLLLLTTGTAYTVGIIALIVGAVLLLVGLL